MNEENSVTQNLSPLCNYTNGSWVYDPKGKVTRYDSTCKEIFKGWNCISSNKSNARDISNWLWKPNDCSLPQFDPVQFLQRFRNTNIGFVGDSLNRNMFVSLVCTLKRVSKEVKSGDQLGQIADLHFVATTLLLRIIGLISWHIMDLQKDYWYCKARVDWQQHCRRMYRHSKLLMLKKWRCPKNAIVDQGITHNTFGRQPCL
ncbi:hypothetical protein GIB67_025937 [Kingdonia uniflora]|uniref:Trichome birefringence-like N-terminal domain-containing protein n=1 Tax=Kingdonia uniflora TaxID=39325 RepID=A0A7J7P2U2_9MAGN|nr:hypothetical protein GIB67_025937 [Kingdonia uniflora]